MTISIYNTLTGAKEPLEPVEPGRVHMYVCGPTTHNYFHIGNARAFVVPDVVKRHLRFRGYEVRHVQNITDIEDKIIQRARDLDVSVEQVVEQYTQAYFEDLQALGCMPADVNPRASAHVDQIINLIEILVDRGHAYAAGGDVYFDVTTFANYGRLSRQSLSDLEAGARVEVDERKRNPGDFTLWKQAKPDEPAWDSPWGKGRPGWHIECSAMSMAYLGETFDIHTGGSDLVFPHHENEIAQSEAATGKPFVKHWLHIGYINISGEKMSKSKGNFVTVRDILQEFDPQVVRLFLLAKHYRGPIDFTEDELRATSKGWNRLLNAYQAVERALAAGDAAGGAGDGDAACSGSATGDDAAHGGSAEGSDTGHAGAWSNGAGDLTGAANEARERFIAAMDDDFNTALGLAALYDLARAANRHVDGTEPGALDIGGLTAVRDTFTDLGDVLGLRFQVETADDGRERVVVANLVDLLLEVRQGARAARNWEMADAIRNRMEGLGIMLEDTPQGTRWKWKE